MRRSSGGLCRDRYASQGELVHRTVCFVVSIVGFLAVIATNASAQSFRLDHFRAVERPDDGFGVRRINELGHLRWSGLVTADYAHDPLVIEGAGQPVSTTCTGVEMFRKKLDRAAKGDNVGLLLDGIEKQHVASGDWLRARAW